MNEKVPAFSVGELHNSGAPDFANGGAASVPCAKTRGPLWFSQTSFLKVEQRSVKWDEHLSQNYF